MAAIQSSRRLAHFSTVRNVDRLIYCVRDGYRSDPAAMAATLKPINGIAKKFQRNFLESRKTGKVVYCAAYWISPGLG